MAFQSILLGNAKSFNTYIKYIRKHILFITFLNYPEFIFCTVFAI